MKRLNLHLFTVAATAAILSIVPQPARAQTGFFNSLGWHLFYVGTDGNVHESFTYEYERDNREADATIDINLLASALVDTEGAPMASFSDYAGEYVYFLDQNFNVHRLYNAASESLSAYIGGAGWRNSLLLPTDGGPIPLYFASSITGLHDASNGESIFFTASASPNSSKSPTVYWLHCPTGDVCNTNLLQPPKSNWTLQPLTTGGAPSPAPASNLASFLDAAGEHLFYIASNQHVVQFWRPLNGNWSWQDLTSWAGGRVALLGSKLTAFGDQPGYHVVFQDTAQQINQLYHPPDGSWVDQDLSVWTKANPAALFSGQLPSPLTSFADSNGEHIFYVDTGARVDELQFPWGGPWKFQPPAFLGNAPAADHCSGLGGFPDQYRGESVGYISGGQVNLLAEAWGKWQDQDSTSLGGGPGAKYHCGF